MISKNMFKVGAIVIGAAATALAGAQEYGSFPG